MNFLTVPEYQRQLLERIPGLSDSLVDSVGSNLKAVGIQAWAIVVIVLLGCLLLVFFTFSLIKKVKFRCCGQTMNKFLVVIIIATLSIGVSFAVYLAPKINAAIILHPTTCTVLQKAQASYTGTPGGTFYRLELKVTYSNGGSNITAIAYDDPLGAFTAGEKTTLLNGYTINTTCSCYYYPSNPTFASLTNISPLDKILIGVTLPIPFLLLLLELFICKRQCGKSEEKQGEEDNMFQAQELGDKNNNDAAGKKRQ